MQAKMFVLNFKQKVIIGAGGSTLLFEAFGALLK